MGYRKITVDGVEHQYTVGKTHVKVRGGSVAEKRDVGHIEQYDTLCECCGTPMSELYPDDPLPLRLVVTPADIADFIRKETRHLVSG